MTRRLEIIQYFDSVVNDVDLMAEELLNLVSSHKNYPDDLLKMINDKRTLLMDEIENVKRYNLDHADENEHDLCQDKTKLFKKYCLLLDMFNWRHSFVQINFNQDNLKKVINEAFCFLIVLDEYIEDRELALFKELISIKSNHYEPMTRSNIFNEPCLNLYKDNIDMPIDVLHRQEHINPIIQTTKQELFKVKHLTIKNLQYISENLISDEAMKLFFKGPLCVQIFDDISYDYHLNDMIRFLKRLQSQAIVDKVILEFDSKLDFNPCIFEHIEQLQEFTSKNQHQPLNSVKIGRLPNLKKLDFSKGHIKSVESNAFRGTPSLEELTLSYNQNINIHPNAFENLFYLRRLCLDHSEIESIAEWAFKDLTSLETLSMKSNRIGHMDVNVLANTKKLNYLDLSNNQLKLDRNSFVAGLSNLETLILDWNGIFRLEENFFADFKKLKILELRSNRIDTLDEHLFASLVNLEILNLNSNKIAQVHLCTFVRLLNLKQLNLSNNKLDIANVDWLSDLTNLEFLNLSNQRFADDISNNTTPELNGQSLKIRKIQRTIAGESFDKLRNLSVLELNGNKIDSIDVSSFRNLCNLNELSLKGNKLTKIVKDTFKSLCNLKVLNLNDNLLEALEPGCFVGLDCLEKLYLSSNRIVFPEHECVFTGLDTLKEINLSHNHLTKLNENFPSNLKNLQKLHLSENEFTSLNGSWFSCLNQLKSLDLSFNKIKVIESNVFESLANIEHLILSNNNISQIEAGSFDKNKNLINVCLLSNRLDQLKDLSVFKHLTQLKTLTLDANQNKKFNVQEFFRQQN